MKPNRMGELESRFEDFHSIVKQFACLMLQHLGDMEGIKKLVSTYERDVHIELVIRVQTVQQIVQRKRNIR